jgi:DegV family protein with EDD domain
MKIAYITDSSSGKSIDDLAKEQIFSLPLQISDGDSTYFDIEQLTIEQNLELLKQKKVMKTSLPSLGLIDELISNIKQKGFDRIIAVPICRGLSGTSNAIEATCREYNMPLKIVDIYTTDAVQLYLIRYIKKCFEDGLNENLIFENVDKIIDSTQTLILPEDMQHLKRGGRLTPVAATLASLLKITPILEINKKTNGKIDVLDKVRTFNKAIDKTIDKAIIPYIKSNYSITVTHVGCFDRAEIVKAKIKAKLPNIDIHIEQLVTPVSCHTGLDAIAIQFFMKL